VERIVFESDVMCAGLFRCAPADPLFPGGAPCSAHTIVFPREVAWIQHEGGPRFVADTSMATIYNRGQVYRRWSVGGRPDRSDWLAFPDSLIRDVVKRFSGADAESATTPLKHGSAPVTAALYARQRQLFAALDECAGGDALAVEELALGLLEEVLLTAYGGKQPARAGSRHTRRTTEAIEFVRFAIARDPGARHSLPSLARACDLSPFHLCREFHRVTGQTLTAYRMQLRLRQSLEQIAAGADLSTVAVDLGFTSHSHFSAAFRRTFGIVPSSLRRAVVRTLQRSIGHPRKAT
jgi:AraC family transcriptional regulator